MMELKYCHIMVLLLSPPTFSLNPTQIRSNLLATQPFKDVFGPNRKRKRPKLMAESLTALADSADIDPDAA